MSNGIYEEIMSLVFLIGGLIPLSDNPRCGDVDAIALRYAAFKQRKPSIESHTAVGNFVIDGNY